MLFALTTVAWLALGVLSFGMPFMLGALLYGAIAAYSFLEYCEVYERQKRPAALSILLASGFLWPLLGIVAVVRIYQRIVADRGIA